MHFKVSVSLPALTLPGIFIIRVGDYIKSSLFIITIITTVIMENVLSVYVRHLPCVLSIVHR